MGAVTANQEADTVIERLQIALGGGRLRLLDDVQGVRRTNTQGGGVARRLQTTVRIHTIHQPVCHGTKKAHKRILFRK